MGYRLVLAWSGVTNNVLPHLYPDLMVACTEAEQVVDRLPPRSRPRIGLVCTVVDVTTGATLATFTRRRDDPFGEATRPLVVDLPAATLDRARQQATRDGRTVEGLVREATELALGVWTERSTGEEM